MADRSQRWRIVLAGPIVLALLAAAAYAIGDAILAPTPVAESPDFIDALLASRAVVAAIRVAIIFASCFVVASVVALIARGQWLTRVGPVHASEQVSEFKAEKRRLQRSLENAHDNIDNLTAELAEAKQLLDRAVRNPRTEE